MIEGIIVIAGMCLTFLPIVIFVNYLLKHVKSKQAFDYHLDNVKDKKGNVGVIIAYGERFLFTFTLMSLGLYMSSFFVDFVFLEIFIISLICYLFVCFFDKKNEK